MKTESITETLAQTPRSGSRLKIAFILFGILFDNNNLCLSTYCVKSRSCIDESKIEIEEIDSVLSLINNKLDGCPILQGSTWNSSTFSLTNLLLKLHQDNYNIIFSQGARGLSQRQYYYYWTSDGQRARDNEMFRTTIYDISHTLNLV
ncbi:unnamed protein product [Rotaria sordida]|uniref:Uncharacterized protein n=1 Tax=Rotaria sordida TaxID=392033 RepID=A0A813VDH7_9BILA|nr:unnamed protein product [Rotaria sordida]CAF0889219.1 unnamed protein product [Rotaria sordida]